MGTATEPHGARSVRAIVAALMLADVAFSFQQTAIIPAIPQIQRDFGATETTSAYLLTGYLVISSVATPLVGKLADRHGKRLMLMISLAAFLGGSIGGALAPSLPALIGFRALQGVGGAVFPLSLAMLRDEVPAERLGIGAGVVTGAFGTGATLGFGVSGVIAEALGWRYIFACGAFVTVLAMALIPLVVRRSRVKTPGGLDLPGAALFTGGLAALLIALTEGEVHAWTAPLTLALFVGFGVLIAGWVARDLRTAEPLLDLHVLGERTVFFTNAATTAIGYVLFGIFFLIPFLVSDRFGGGPVAMSLYLLPAAAGQVVAGVASGWLTRRLEPKWVLSGGMALTTAGAASLAAWHASGWQVVALVLVLGLGFGLVVGVASAVITASVSERETGIATALNSVLRRVGGGVGGQVAAVLIAAIALPGGGPTALAFTIAFAASAGVAGLGTACALAVGRRGRDDATA